MVWNYTDPEFAHVVKNAMKNEKKEGKGDKMIKLEMISDNGNVGVKYDEEKVSLQEVSMMVFELSRIKKILLEKNFEYEFMVNGEETADD